MDLAFKTLTVEHFRTFGAKQTFDLSPSPGLWFLRGKNQVEPRLGSNGSGKSTLTEALCWLLTGETSKGLKNPDIRPWAGKGTPAVELLVEIDDEPTTIRRVAKTNGLSINGKEVGPQEAVSLLQMPFDLLTNTVIYPQGAPLFLDRTPGKKMELFSGAMRLARWEERSDRASAKVKELERLEAEIEGEITGARSALERTEALYERTKASSEAYAAERETRDRELAQEIAALDKQTIKQEQEAGEIELAHDQAWVRLREMREDVKKLYKVFAEAQNALNAEENRVVLYERDIKRLERELAELGEADECPVCKQSVKGTDFGEHKRELKKEIKRLQGFVEQGVSPKTQRANDDAFSALEGFKEGLDKTEAETDELQTKLNHAKPNAERLRTKLNALRVQQQEREREENPYVEQLQVLRKERQKQQANITELEEDLQKARIRIERTKFWVKGFKDVALFLIEEVLQELEAVTNSMLAEVGLVGWQVLYDVERETKSGTIQRGINVGILQPGGNKDPVKWECWSGGEGQRIRLVGTMALSEVLLRHAGISTNLEIFDEPTSHLSAMGVEDLIGFLRDRADVIGKTVWVIDHMAREGSAFVGTVTVTKTEKGSVLS